MSLRIHTFGALCVERSDSAILDSAWKTQKLKTLLNIFLTYRGHTLIKDQAAYRLLRPAPVGRAGAGERRWRGQIEHIGTGDKVYFQVPNSLLVFLAEQIRAIEAAETQGHQPTGWADGEGGPE